jgi:hypothetical protein
MFIDNLEEQAYNETSKGAGLNSFGYSNYKPTGKTFERSYKKTESYYAHRGKETKLVKLWILN